MHSPERRRVERRRVERLRSVLSRLIRLVLIRKSHSDQLKKLPRQKSRTRNPHRLLHHRTQVATVQIFVECAAAARPECAVAAPRTFAPFEAARPASRRTASRRTASCRAASRRAASRRAASRRAASRRAATLSFVTFDSIGPDQKFAFRSIKKVTCCSARATFCRTAFWCFPRAAFASSEPPAALVSGAAGSSTPAAAARSCIGTVLCRCCCCAGAGCSIARCSARATFT